MIAYFDTSALIPLLVAEPSSSPCSRLWNDATRVMSSRLIYPEARAALAQAERMRRLTVAELGKAVEDLKSIAMEIDYLEVTADLAASAGDLAQAHGLRGYDAVHLASAALVNDAELVLATGDRDLGSAARTIGISVALTTR
ncbi:type II toxin-antitoxin system VapC family toxin [soil metagenome]